MKEYKSHPRTLSQNKAIHLYLTWVSQALNDAQLPIDEVLKHFTMELDWTMESAKSILWHTAQKRMLNKSSTTELNKIGDIDKVYDAVNRFLIKLAQETKREIPHIPFPWSCKTCGGIGKHNLHCPEQH